jgi:hypothetical protein
LRNGKPMASESWFVAGKSRTGVSLATTAGRWPGKTKRPESAPKEDTTPISRAKSKIDRRFIAEQ